MKTDTVKQPSQLVVNATKGNVTCASTNNGFINLNPTGGNGGYTFLWNDNNTQQNRNNLTAGIYAVTITDSKGCTATRQDTILQTASLNVSGNVSSITCFGANNGSIVVSATGGSGNYTFNWSNGATGVNLSNLSPGTYTVTVDDGNNCTGTGSFTIIQPDSIGITATVVNPNCFGGTGSVTLTLSGGTGNLNAAWSNNANPSALAAGTYTVTVSDVNGCTNTRTFTLTQPDSLKISATITNASANGASDGSIILTVSGGTPNYDYDWSNNATTKDLINISAGTYTVTVTDDKGCTKTATFVVSQPSGIGKAGERSPIIALNISGKKIQLMLEESVKFEDNIITVYNMQGQKFYSIETKNLLTKN
ncbi:MAG: SprB repeat-containing protein, partial [Bacteroidia bacterium]|nr:SprB repeat-containing protein [Bacteroidia bacterium]